MQINNTNYWVHDWSPFFIEFPENFLGLEGIRYYGLAYLLGFIAIGYFLKLCDKKGKIRIGAQDRSDLMTYIILGSLLGGRLGFVLLYDLKDLLANPLLFFRIDQGGMSSHGGMIGATLSGWLFCKKKKYSFLKLADCVTAIGPICLVLGRFANFINGELWGKISTVKWAILFPHSPLSYSPLTNYFGIQPRHPSQLYALATEGMLPLIYVQWRFWFTRTSSGQIFGEFLLLYSVMRIFNEIFREPDASLILGLSRGQFYSFFMLIAGLIIWKIAQKSELTVR